MWSYAYLVISKSFWNRNIDGILSKWTHTILWYYWHINLIYGYYSSLTAFNLSFSVQQFAVLHGNVKSCWIKLRLATLPSTCRKIGARLTAAPDQGGGGRFTVYWTPLSPPLSPPPPPAFSNSWISGRDLSLYAVYRFHISTCNL